MRTVIFDIDGTLADCTHRLHHVTGARRDYAAFFGAMGEDPCYKEILNLLDQLSASGNAIVLCTGRPDDYREPTKKWLINEAVGYAELYMRAAGDYRPDHVVKAELLHAMREEGYEPWLVIDDRPSVVRMWREQGLTCLQCRDWNERSI